MTSRLLREPRYLAAGAALIVIALVAWLLKP